MKAFIVQKFEKRIRTMKLETLFTCAISTEKDLRSYARKEIRERFGIEMGELLIQYLDKKMPLEALEAILFPINDKETADCYQTVKNVMSSGKEKLSMGMLLELYRCKDAFLKEKALEIIVKDNTQFIYYLMNRYFPNQAASWHEDMFQSGTIGIIKALEKYVPEKGAFITYAKPYIIHELAAQSFFETELNTKYYAFLQTTIRDAVNQLQMQDLEVTPEEIIRMTGLSEKQVKRELDVLKCYDYIYLDEFENPEEIPIHRFGRNVDEVFEENENRRVLEQAIDALPELLATIVRLHLIYEYNYTQIAKLIGSTRGKVEYRYIHAIQSLKTDLKLREYFLESEFE